MTYGTLYKMPMSEIILRIDDQEETRVDLIYLPIDELDDYIPL